jgi:hypothetical protein
VIAYNYNTAGILILPCCMLQRSSITVAANTRSSFTPH